MVSFQCHSCGDTVKKPKLDQHYSRCHSAFDCLDCSKTFNSPPEWKPHISCVSEAEKYEKSLYKGPKKTNHTQTSWSSFKRGRGGYSNGGQRHSATGANDIPLGTRESPKQPESTGNKKRKREEEEKTTKTDSDEQTEKKHKKDEGKAELLKSVKRALRSLQDMGVPIDELQQHCNDSLEKRKDKKKKSKSST